ncbi:MAG: hypothetical protein IPO90_11530 [Flavobacteriales bacterium]|nr:hypothetical protein [Flavobacteriales bacterium]
MEEVTQNCDDGIACTVDSYNCGTAQCTHVLQDADGDGVCDASDPCPTEAPGAGDVFATAVDITVSGGAVGDATCYSNAYTDVSTPGDASASGDHDVFYSYTTGACALTLDVELCGGDVLHLLDASGAHLATGDATLPAFCGAITNGSSLLAFPVAPNTLYHIVVEADAEFIISGGRERQPGFRQRWSLRCRRSLPQPSTRRR